MRTALLAVLVTAFFAAAGSARADPYHLVFSADRDGDRDLYAVNAAGGAVVAVTHNSEIDAAAALAPDRRTIAVQRGPSLVVIGSGGGERVVAHGHPLAWSPDGRSLSLVDPNYVSLRILDLVHGTTTLVARKHDGILSAAWSPDGRRLAYSDSSCDAYVADLRTHRRTRLGCADESDPVWSPAAGALAFAGESNSFEYGLTVVRPRAKRCVVSGDGPVWSPNGRWIVFRRRSGRATGVAVLDVGRCRVSRRLAAARAGPPAWSPDGNRVAFEQRGRVVVVGRGGHGRTVLHGPAGVADAAPFWSPDGRFVAFVAAGALPEIVVADARGGPARIVARGRRPELVGWALGAAVGPVAPLLPLPPVEEVRGNSLLVRGRVTEIAAEGDRVAALVTGARVCRHVTVWRIGAPRPLVLRPSRECEGNGSMSHLKFEGGAVHWMHTYCGNNCYETACSWTLDSGSRKIRCGGETVVGYAGTGPVRPLPRPRSRVGNVTAHRVGEAIVVGRRTIRAPAPAKIVDFELTAAGLFYAYRGHVVFVPHG